MSAGWNATQRELKILELRKEITRLRNENSELANRIVGDAATPTHDAIYLRGWNEGIEHVIELLEGDRWVTLRETIGRLIEASPVSRPDRSGAA